MFDVAASETRGGTRDAIPVRARSRFTTLPSPPSDEIAGDERAATGDLLRELWSRINARKIDGAARVNDWIWQVLRGRGVV